LSAPSSDSTPARATESDQDQEDMAGDAHVHGSAARTGALLLAFVNLVGAAVVAFFGLLANGLRCDDNCSIAPGWRNDPNAWQWGATFALTLVILGSALLLNVGVQMRHTPQLRRLAVLFKLGALVLLAFLASTATGRHGGWDYLVFLFAFFGATGAGSARLATA